PVDEFFIKRWVIFQIFIQMFRNQQLLTKIVTLLLQSGSSIHHIPMISDFAFVFSHLGNSDCSNVQRGLEFWFKSIFSNVIVFSSQNSSFKSVEKTDTIYATQT